MQKIYTVADTPLGWRHWWIVFVSSLGQFVGCAVATIAGVIIPMLAITENGDLPSWMQGLIGAADLLGIVFGSLIFGKLTDRFGYLPFFRLCPAIIILASLPAIFFPYVGVLIPSLFAIGFGIGGEYSLDSDYVSELMPTDKKMMMLGIVKTGASLGNIVAAAIAFLLIIHWDDASNWPDLMWIITITGAVMLLTRLYFFESPKWLMEHGQPQKAAYNVKKFLGSNVILASNAVPPAAAAKTPEEENLTVIAFCRKYWNRVMLSGVPWACEGLGVYGIGVFIPVLVMALGITHQGIDADRMMHVAESVKSTFWISCIMLPGFLIGVWLTSRKINYCRLQSMTFWASSLSLLLLLVSYKFHWPVWISLVAFMGFELFLNLGPHLVTYLLPPDIYPVEIRGQGTGIAAAIGKAGAVAGVFIIPLLLKVGGGVLVLAVSAGVMAAGALVTTVYGRKVYKK